MPWARRNPRRDALLLAAFCAPLLAACAALAAPFLDATPQSGIPDLRHGEGVVMRDSDGDGLPEIYLANVRGPDALLQNLGGGRFREITAQAGLAEAETIGASWADFDGDGAADLYLVRGAFPKGINALRLGDGKGFSPDGAEAAGVRPAVNGISAAPADFDGDGKLDLFVADWGGDKLYRNESLPGSPRFFDFTQTGGVQSETRSWGATWADFDGNGKLDLFVARGDVGGKGGSALYFNRGSRFERAAGGQFDRLWPMGAVAADFDGDGAVDLFLTNWDGPAKLFLNNGGGALRDATGDSSISVLVSVGAAAGDLDGDMLIDLVVAGYKGPLKVYKNLGGGRFEEMSKAWAFGDGKKNEGVAIGDIDGDGLNDVYVASLEGGRLYRNAANGQKTLVVRPRGTDARVFGATVRLSTPDGKLAARRELSSAHGFCSQNPPEAAFPVDGKTEYTIEVTFSDGSKSGPIKAMSGLVRPALPGEGNR